VATSGFLLGLCLEPCDGEAEGPFCITVGGCSYGSGTPLQGIIEGAEVTLSHAGSGYTETRTTDAAGVACFTPTAGAASYAYTVTPPSGSGYAAKSGTIAYTPGLTNLGISLDADGDHVCVPCCERPVPKSLSAGTIVGDIPLAYGLIPALPPLPLGWFGPGDGYGWYASVTSLHPDAIPASAPTSNCATPSDCASRPYATSATGDTVTVKYWFWCDGGTWRAAKSHPIRVAWDPTDENPCDKRAYPAASSGIGMNEAVGASSTDCNPLNVSFAFVGSGVSYIYGCGLSTTSGVAPLGGWAEVVSLTP
jgi:hypothetical protein